MNRYPIRMLGDLVLIEDAKRVPLSGAERQNRPGPYPYFGAAKIFDHIDDFIFEGDRILVGEDGSVVRTDGRPYVQHATGRFWVNNHAHVLCPIDGVDFYFLKAAVEVANVRGLVTGAAQPKITQRNLCRIEIPTPDEATQQKIGSVLRNIEDLVKNNGRRIELLEETARLLYREWFVYYRYPGHEDIPLVESELGPIPQGWKVRNLFELADVGFGFSFKSKGFAESGTRRVVRIRDVPKNTTSTWTDEIAEDRYVIDDGDTLIGMDGDFHMCIWADGLAYLNQRVARIRTQGELAQLHLHLALEAPIKRFNETIIGTTVAHLGKRHLEEIHIPLPNQLVAVEASRVFEAIQGLQQRLRQTNTRLIEARGLLLPRLVSGDLDVSDLDLNLETVG